MKRFVILCALAAPASAQVTNCQLFPNAVSCQTTQRGPGVDWSLLQPQSDLDLSAMAQAQQAQRQAQVEKQQRVDAAIAVARAQAAGRLVAEGKCDEARASALNAGDFMLAQQVAEACK